MPKGILRIPIGLIVLCLALIDIANYGGNALNLRYDLEFYLRNLDLDMSFFLNVLMPSIIGCFLIVTGTIAVVANKRTETVCHTGNGTADILICALNGVTLLITLFALLITNRVSSLEGFISRYTDDPLLLFGASAILVLLIYNVFFMNRSPSSLLPTAVMLTVIVQVYDICQTREQHLWYSRTYFRSISYMTNDQYALTLLLNIVTASALIITAIMLYGRRYKNRAVKVIITLGTLAHAVNTAVKMTAYINLNYSSTAGDFLADNYLFIMLPILIFAYVISVNKRYCFSSARPRKLPDISEFERRVTQDILPSCGDLSGDTDKLYSYLKEQVTNKRINRKEAQVLFDRFR